MRRGWRAELPLACSCVTRAVLAASERWCNLLLEPRKRCDVRAYMPRALGGLPLRTIVLTYPALLTYSPTTHLLTYSPTHLLWSRANDATSACRCRAHFCGLRLCTAAKAVANARMRRGCRAELPVACSCVTRISASNNIPLQLCISAATERARVPLTLPHGATLHLTTSEHYISEHYICLLHYM